MVRTANARWGKPWSLGAALVVSCGIEVSGLKAADGGSGGVGLVSGTGGAVDSGWPDGTGGTVLSGGTGGGAGSTGGSAGAPDGGDADASGDGDTEAGGTGGADAGDTGTGGTTGWKPLDFPNCVLWLDAADTSSLAVTGSGVQLWADKCGGHPVTAAGNGKPAHIAALANGLGGVRFDGADDVLEIGGATKSTAAYVLFFVVSTTQNPPAEFPFWSNRHLSNAGGTVTYSGMFGQRLFLYQDSAQSAALVGNSAPSKVPHLFEFSVGTLGRRLVVDGVLDAQDTVVVSTATGLPGGNLASDLPNKQFSALDVFEVIFYDRELTPAELGVARGFLESKWALP